MGSNGNTHRKLRPETFRGAQEGSRPGSQRGSRGQSGLTIPAKHPLMIRVRLHMPPKVGRTFHTKRTVIPPVEHAIKVDKAAVPMISPSPG